MNNLVEEAFICHLDTESHSIPLSDFLKISESMNIMCKTVAETLYNTTKCTVMIQAPEAGSMKILYSILIPVALAFVPDITNGTLKEFTGHDVSYYVGKTERALVDSISNLNQKTAHELKTLSNNSPDTIQPQIDKIIKSSSDFYNTLQKNKTIKGVGFSNDHIFPIKRKDFSLHTTNDVLRDVPNEQVLKRLIIYKSLNVNEDGKWEFRDCADGSHFSASIEDESFKIRFLNGKNPLKKTKKDDEILALVEYDKQMKNGVVGRGDILIREIYTFNGKPLKDTPDGIVENLALPKKENDLQGDLFA